ncbi:MAG: hypothetical protein JRG96_08745 [Deltaproteobacteria bacterium]|nr:hypothetical protein [Deltaproteobacteria bacterium]MBW2419221.1 hypothetical protein [Deltaproteobacteria bacterium]
MGYQSGMGNGGIRRIAFFILLLLVIAAAAAGAAPNEDSRDSSVAACSQVPYGAPRPTGGVETAEGVVSPPNPDGPTLVEVGLFVVDLDNVDVPRAAFRFEGYAEFVWCDPRLAFDPAEVGTPIKRFIGPASGRIMERIWVPNPTLVNRKGSMTLSKRTIEVHPDGTVRLEGLFTAELAAEYDLRLFPFDHQTLPIEVESFTWNAETLVFRLMREKTGYDQHFKVPEWTIAGLESRVDEVGTIQGRGNFSRLTLEIGVDRESGFYITKVAFPLLLIVAMSWSVFWMVDEGFGSRTRVTTTGVLTIVAYQFAISKDLPKVAYLTFFDTMMVISFTLVASTVAENLLVSRVGERRPELAVQIDRASRVLFPLFYLLSIALVAVHYGI